MNTKIHALKTQFLIIEGIRDFFKQQHFIDVLTPPMVKNPGIEAHIHPFRVKSEVNQRDTDFFLHTSPEFFMKELLSLGFENIYTLSYSFRDENYSDIHRPQFLMLEWYRAHARYEKIMEDCENMIKHLIHHLRLHKIELSPDCEKFNLQKMTVQEIIFKYAHFDILNFLDKEKLLQLIRDKFPEVPLPPIEENNQLEWDDVYFLFFLNVIEPHLKNIPFLLLYEFPAPLSALSTLKDSNPDVCERFEIYARGIELCNCFNELRDLEIQENRFKLQMEIKSKYYHYQLSPPHVLFESLRRGIPQSAGIALGVERLHKILTNGDMIFWD